MSYYKDEVYYESTIEPFKLSNEVKEIDIINENETSTALRFTVLAEGLPVEGAKVAINTGNRGLGSNITNKDGQVTLSSRYEEIPIGTIIN